MNEAKNSFNKYLVRLPLQIILKYTKSVDYLKTPQISTIFLEVIEPIQVFEITNKLKPELSVGHDEIFSKILKETIEYIKYPLTQITLTVIFSKQLKTAKVILILKASHPTGLKTNRSISLLPAFSKILERLMFNKVICFLDSNNILYKYQ